MLKLDEELFVLKESRKLDEMPPQLPVLSQPMSIAAFAFSRTTVSTLPTMTNENLYKMLAEISAQKVRVRINNVTLEPRRTFVHEGALV
jgi:hypothetical protein